MNNLLTLLLVLLFASGCSRKTEDEGMYLFTYFKGNGDGLHLAYSADGLNWKELGNNKVFITPAVGKDKLMRDPSIVEDKYGVFHMVWTSGWWDRGIGYACSEDLIHWSEQQYIPVMEGFEGTKNTWAPELFYDRKSDLFYIFWSSTIPGAFPEIPTVENEKGLNHRQYYVTTKDFKKFSETKLFFEPGFSVIDGAILQQEDRYVLFVKNENSLPAEKNIRYTVNDKPYDFPVSVSEPITGNYWAEGPAPLQVGEYVYVYFDKYMDGKYGAVRSKDLKSWEDVSDRAVFPKEMRHGTAFRVSKKLFEVLQKEVLDNQDRE